MGITINVEDSKILRAPIDRALEKGLAEGVSRGLAKAVANLLHLRFPHEVPDSLVDHLSGLRPEVLEDMHARSATAPSVAEALGSYMPSKAAGPSL